MSAGSSQKIGGVWMVGEASGRKHVRNDCDIPAIVKTAAGEQKGTCADISLGGTFVTGVQLTEGELVEVLMTQPSGVVVKATAEVRRAQQEPLGAGLRFTQLSITALRSLASITEAAHSR